MSPSKSPKPQTVRPHTTKLALWGLVLLAAWLFLSSWVTTQWLAHQFGYQPALGERGALGLYGPFDWFDWIRKYYRSQRGIFGVGGIGFMVAAAAGFLTFALSLGFGIRSSKAHTDLHGSAYWATLEDVQKAGFVPRKPGLLAARPPSAGVYCGAFESKNGTRHYLRHNGPEHVAVIAPTRSGKGVSLVAPTLLSWPHSAVIHDQKGELWAMTAGWRQRDAGNLVMKFDPAAVHGSVAFNPLDEVRVGTEHEVGDIQNLVTMIVDPDGKGLTDHWSKTAHALLSGLVLHLQYKALAAGKTASLYDLAFALSDPDRKIEQLYSEMLHNRHVVTRDEAGNPVLDPTSGRALREPHPVVAGAARDMLNRADAERSSVLSTAMSFLTLYRDPLVAKNVSRSDFRITDLMNAEKPVSLFIVVRPEDKDRMRPLIRLILNQIVRVLLRPELKYVDGRQVDPHRHRLLLMVDEFPSLGRLDVFQESLAFIAGYGIKAFLIMQDVSQLHQAYTQHESILSNCHIRIAFAPNRLETAQWLSNSCGVTTRPTENISTSGSRFGGFLGSVTRSFQMTQRPLLTADEALRLKAPEKDASGQIVSAGEVIVQAAGFAPIKGLQSLYFVDPVFSERVKIPAPAVSDRIPYTPVVTALPFEVAPAAATAEAPEGSASPKSGASPKRGAPPLAARPRTPDSSERFVP